MKGRLNQAALPSVRVVRGGDHVVAHDMPSDFEQWAALVEDAVVTQHLLGENRIAHHNCGSHRTDPYPDQTTVEGGQRLEECPRLS